MGARQRRRRRFGQERRTRKWRNKAFPSVSSRPMSPGKRGQITGERGAVHCPLLSLNVIERPCRRDKDRAQNEARYPLRRQGASSDSRNVKRTATFSRRRMASGSFWAAPCPAQPNCFGTAAAYEVQTSGQEQNWARIRTKPVPVLIGNNRLTTEAYSI